METLNSILPYIVSILVAYLAARPGLQALREQRDKNAADAIKAITESERLEQEITNLVLARAKIQLDEMQKQIDELKCENAKLKVSYYDLEKRYNDLKHDYDKVLSENACATLKRRAPGR
jgi:predicted nuclease with TOPRIM domain